MNSVLNQLLKLLKNPFSLLYFPLVPGPMLGVSVNGQDSNPSRSLNDLPYADMPIINFSLGIFLSHSFIGPSFDYFKLKNWINFLNCLNVTT